MIRSPLFRENIGRTGREDSQFLFSSVHASVTGDGSHARKIFGGIAEASPESQAQDQ